MLIFLQIFGTAGLLFGLYTTGINVKMVFQGCMAMQRISREEIRNVRCRNVIYNAKGLVLLILVTVVEIYCFYELMKLSKALHLSWSIFCYTTLIIIYAISLVLHIIESFMGKYAYLTAEGIAYFMGDIKFVTARILWEPAGVEGRLPNVLQVYPPKAKNPIRLEFDEDLELAHELTRC